MITVVDLDRFSLIQGGSCGGACDRLELVRHCLHWTLHGFAGKQPVRIYTWICLNIRKWLPRWVSWIEAFFKNAGLLQSNSADKSLWLTIRHWLIGESHINALLSQFCLNILFMDMTQAYSSLNLKVESCRKNYPAFTNESEMVGWGMEHFSRRR